MTEKFFQKIPMRSPKIYAYKELGKEYENLLKIGYTTRSIEERMKEHYPTKGPEGIKRYELLLLEPAMRSDGSYFMDHEVRRLLIKNGFKNVGGEWIDCNVEDVKASINSLMQREEFDSNRILNFKLRPEQSEAIIKTKSYFDNFESAENRIPHFLWNCKMRFGKTYTTYKLANEMGWKKVLILTFKPAVENSWKQDLESHVDFKNWQFVSKSNKNFDDLNKDKNTICFGSFQDFLGKNSVGGIKPKNELVHKIDWDCIVLDEYHYGAWNDTAKELYANETSKEKNDSHSSDQDLWEEDVSPLKTSSYLYLSGTPFKAIESGEFIEEQIYDWTYHDEQEAKLNWNGDDNPYSSLPRMVMMTYQLPEAITSITTREEFNEFDLNVFVKAEGEYENAKFKYENEVQKWLDLIRGSGFNNIYENLQLGENKPVLPFSDARLISLLNHTFWFLPSIASCYAMKNLISKRNNSFYHDYEVIVCAGDKAGIGVKALDLVEKEMDDPLNSKTITLSCGKLATGVTVKPWTGIFMLRNTSSPETYFQAAFRVQSPWTISTELDKKNPEEILKNECYIFDFAPNRALRLITDYSCRLNVSESSPEKKVSEFIKFLPVLCFDGSSMKQINSEEVLDFGMVGTSGSQLAKKFESARLVHVDNMTLKRLMANPKALEAIMNIEGWRNLNSDLEKIINKSEEVNKIKTTLDEDEVSVVKKKELNELQKEIKSVRKEYQSKLLQLSTRIPLFMYLTDYREETLKDVIMQLEPGLFKKVTGITVEEFEIFLSIGLFNSTLMNSAVFSFKRYENSSLHYASGFTKYKPEEVGLFDTKISREEFLNLSI